MNRLFFILLLVAATTAYAKDFVKDAEPAILEVHYTRIEVTDTTKRNSHFFKDPVMLRIGKNKSVFAGLRDYGRIQLWNVTPRLSGPWIRQKL